jgi:hypothetical protein
MSGAEDHAFTVAVDIVRLDQESDRVVITGYLGSRLEVGLNGDRLEFKGDEASISILIDRHELGSILSDASPEAGRLVAGTGAQLTG